MNIEELFADFPELLQADVTWEREIYAHFGLLYMGFALLEHSLINAATIKLAVTNLKQYSKPNRLDWEKCHDLAFSKSCDQTLGNLINIVLKISEFKDMSEAFERVKKIRDYFSHHFFRREAAHMGERESALALLVDMRSARGFVGAVELDTRPRYSKYIARLGLPVPTEDYVNKESKKIREDELGKLSRNELPRGLDRWLNRGPEE